MSEKKPGAEIAFLHISPIYAPLAQKWPIDLEKWIAEPEWNGPHVIVYITPGSNSIKTENGPITAKFPEFQPGLIRLGENHKAIALARIIHRKTKATNSNTSQERKLVQDRIDGKLKPESSLEKQFAVCHLVFTDLISLDGDDLRLWPLSSRKKKLENFLSTLREGQSEIYQSPYSADLGAMMQKAKNQGFAEVVFKRIDSEYRLKSGTDHNWKKFKTERNPK